MLVSLAALDRALEFLWCLSYGEGYFANLCLGKLWYLGHKWFPRTSDINTAKPALSWISFSVRCFAYMQCCTALLSLRHCVCWGGFGYGMTKTRAHGTVLLLIRAVVNQQCFPEFGRRCKSFDPENTGCCEWLGTGVESIWQFRNVFNTNKHVLGQYFTTLLWCQHSYACLNHL